jgi:hypothetical protein
MENDDTKNSKGETPADPSPVAPKKQTRKERSKANETSQKTHKKEKHGLWRNWKALSRTRQVELSFLGLVAIGGIGYLIAYICVSVWQGRQARAIAQMEHAPLVIHSRPPELLMPFTCDAKDGLRTGNMQSFVKNIGNATAFDVNPFFGTRKIIPEKKRGQPFFDDPPVGDCGAKIDKTPMDFPLPPGVEKSPQLRQSVMTLPPLSDGETVQLYITECVYYSDDSAIKHGTCDTYRLFLPSSDPLDRFGGSPSFFCDGVPKMGRFTESIGGHCQK